MPFSAAFSARSTEVCGVMEDMSTSSAPRLAFSRMPSGPYAMASTCGDAGTIVMTTSASSTASAIEDAPVPATRPAGRSCPAPGCNR